MKNLIEALKKPENVNVIAYALQSVPMMIKSTEYKRAAEILRAIEADEKESQSGKPKE